MAQKRLRTALLDKLGALTPPEDRGAWGPYRFYGTQDVNGADGPWYDAPLGSLYSKRTTSLASMFMKVTDDGDTADWTEVALRGALPVSLWGAVGDGVTDDTAAFNAAFSAASAGECVSLQSNCVYKITARVTIAAGVRVIGNNAKILFAPTNTAPNYGQCFLVAASNVWIDRLRFDGSSMPTSAQTVSYYGIEVYGTVLAHISNIRITNCEFDNMEAHGAWTSGGTIPPTTYATHAIYGVYVDGITISDNRIDTIAGAGIYVCNCTDVSIRHNTIADTQSYSINLDHGVNGAFIFDNTISGSRVMCRYWGGSINLAGNNSAGEVLANIIISNNHCSGTHSYGSVIVINSASGVLCEGNTTKDIVSGTATLEVAHISMQTEGIGGTTHVPCTGIAVVNNVLRAGGPGQRAIIATNPTSPTNPVEGIYATGLTIHGNHCYSADEDMYFTAGIGVHGYKGGYRNIDIVGNYVEVYPHYVSFGGAIGLIATNTNGFVYDVNIRNNFLRSIAAPTGQSYEIGLYVGQYVDRVSLGGNRWKSFTYAVRKFTNSGPEFFGLEDDMFSDNTYKATTEVVASFTDGDTTPSVANGRLFKTANTNNTTITALDGGVPGQTVKIIINDAKTTIDFTSTILKGNGGADWSPVQYDHMVCTFEGTYWYCEVSDNTA